MMHSAHHNDHMEKVRKLARGAGYKAGGEAHSMKKTAKKTVHEHEKHDHPGKPLTKLKEGGHAEGERPRHRLDKMARGGAKKGHSKVAVNIVMPPGQKQPVPIPVPAGGGMQRPPMGPPAPMNPGAPPMGGPPMGARPPGMMKDGGKAVPDMKAGAGSGLGRLEKTKNEKKLLKGKKGGGECS